MRDAVQAGYEASAGELIDKFEAVCSARLFAPVRHFLPEVRSRILDIGAGTGRDASWFASMGHSVVAVEPVEAFRLAGENRHKSPEIEWVNSVLPGLDGIAETGRTFDLVVICAVWQHLDDDQRQAAFPVLRTIISRNGRLILSIRHGAGAPSRPVFPAKASDACAWADMNGFRLIHETSAQSAQAVNRVAGVTWTWMVFQVR